MTIEHIFADDRPHAQCHASTLCRLPSGDFVAAWFGGTEEGNPDVAIWGATRSAAGWSAPRRLAKVDDRPHWNPVLFTAPDGRVHLFFKTGVKVALWETWRQVSADGGNTWSDPQPLVPGDVGGRGPVKNKPIVLADGAWLAPASVEPNKVWDAFTDRSADGGQTWAASPLAPIDHTTFQGRGVIQPTLWESAPGRVHMLLRSTCACICRSDSADGGRTWGPVTCTDLPNNNSGLDLAQLADGRLVLVYNPVAGDWAARTPLSVAVSADNGATWQRRFDLETEPGEYSYPSIIAVPGGVAGVYTWRRERIAFWQAAAEEL